MRTLLPLLLILLASCGQEDLRAKLRIGLNPWPGYLDLAVADSEGIFARHGLDVQIVEYSSLHDMSRAFQMGQIDFMPCTLVEVLEVNQGKRRAEVIWVADASEGADVVLAHAISSAAELRGKRIAYEPNSLGIYVLARMLDRAGLTMTDVEPIGMDQTQMVEAMEAKRIDAAVTYPPSSLSIRELDGVRAVFTTAEIPGEVIDVFSVDSAILDADPTFLQRFYASMAELESFSRANPETAITHKCRHMGLDRSGWEEATAGARYYSLVDQFEWIWGSRRIHDSLARMTEALRATCGPRRQPGDEAVASRRPAPPQAIPPSPR